MKMTGSGVIHCGEFSADAALRAFHFLFKRPSEKDENTEDDDTSEKNENAEGDDTSEKNENAEGDMDGNA